MAELECKVLYQDFRFITAAAAVGLVEAPAVAAAALVVWVGVVMDILAQGT